MQLDENSIQPLYQQLAESLAQKILGGLYQEGAKLPTEEALSREHKVSRITVRNALKVLSQDNLIASKQGKGTFVCGNNTEQDISAPSSFVCFCTERGYTPSVRILFSGYRPPDGDDVRILGMEKEELMVVIERVLCMDGTPVLYESFHFRQRYSFLLSENLNNPSIPRILKEKYSLTLRRLYRSIELVFAANGIAKHLALQAGYPLLFIESHVETLSTQDRSRGIQYAVGDKFKLEL